MVSSRVYRSAPSIAAKTASPVPLTDLVRRQTATQYLTRRPAHSSTKALPEVCAGRLHNAGLAYTRMHSAAPRSTSPVVMHGSFQSTLRTSIPQNTLPSQPLQGNCGAPVPAQCRQRSQTQDAQRQKHTRPSLASDPGLPGTLQCPMYVHGDASTCEMPALVQPPSNRLR